MIKQGDLWVLESGQEPLRLTGDGCNSSPAWSPDGKWLLFYKFIIIAVIINSIKMDS
ncbi:MAG: hypothetical protein PHT62_09680 [Desulfotomaculaceae bacterium]|nr:hypothetical protein [Desulfotomaculaceae bacterium]